MTFSLDQQPPPLRRGSKLSREELRRVLCNHEWQLAAGLRHCLRCDAIEKADRSLGWGVYRPFFPGERS